MLPSHLGVKPLPEHTKATLLRVGSLFMVVAFWPVMAVLTFLFWQDSVLLVLFLSLYANWRVDLDGWQIARTERRQMERSD